MDAFTARHKKSEARSEAVKAAAEKAGYVMVRVSPRRHMIVKLNGRHATTPAGAVQAVAVLTGEVMLASATWEECWHWLRENSDATIDPDVWQF